MERRSWLVRISGAAIAAAVPAAVLAEASRRQTHRERYPDAFGEYQVLTAAPLRDLADTVSRMERVMYERGWME